MLGGGTSLNIIRIGGALEQFDIVLCNDLNGCISNPLVGTNNYSLTWNSDYPIYKARDMTQNNTLIKYFYLGDNNKGLLMDHLGPNYYNEFYCQKNDFSIRYGICKFRPIIEFRE